MPVIAVGPLDKPLRTRAWDAHCALTIGRKIDICPWRTPQQLTRRELRSLGFVIAAAELSLSYDQGLENAKAKET